MSYHLEPIISHINVNIIILAQGPAPVDPVLLYINSEARNFLQDNGNGIFLTFSSAQQTEQEALPAAPSSINKGTGTTICCNKNGTGN